MAFDAAGNLYVTEFSGQSVSRFNTNGFLLGTFGSGYDQSPESIVFDNSGNAYVGQADGTQDILKFDSQGNPLAAFDVAIENRGSNWIDLASDQCTMFYTSEGPSIKRFDVCNNAQLPDFATGVLHNAGFALRLLPDGGLLVADLGDIDRLDAAGNIVQSYDVPGEDSWFALNLDPNGTSFWSADSSTSNVYKFDIASGAQLLRFNTGTPSSTVFGLAVHGGLPPDSDDDGVLDTEDNCPGDPNPDQQDSNLDGIGNACQATTALDTTAFLQANLDGSSSAEATDPAAGEPPLAEQLVRIIDFRIDSLGFTPKQANDLLNSLVDSQVELGLVAPEEADQLVSDVLQQIPIQFSIQEAKTKCGKDGKDYMRIGGKVQNFFASQDLTVEIGSDPAGIFGPFGPVTIPAGTRGPVEVDGGKVKVTLPDDGTGIFQINVDVTDLNDCTGDETEAELTLILNGAVDTITLEQETDSKFHSKK